MVYCIGLTGGIASGKSTVAAFFSELGIHVIFADKISHELSAKGQPAYEQIIAHFGSEILLEDDEINRRKLRDIIFTNIHERTWLEQLLHPLIRKQIKEQVDSCSTPYCVVEIPLLIDQNTYPYINRILLIHTPEKLQITRIMERDKCSREQAEAILAAQPDISLRIQHANDVIINELGYDALKQAVEKLHLSYLHFSELLRNISPARVK